MNVIICICMRKLSQSFGREFTTCFVKDSSTVKINLYNMDEVEHEREI